MVNLNSLVICMDALQGLLRLAHFILFIVILLPYCQKNGGYNGYSSRSESESEFSNKPKRKHHQQGSLPQRQKAQGSRKADKVSKGRVKGQQNRTASAKKAAPAPMKIRPPKENEMKGTYDPNYQTLAGLNNDDVFKPKGGSTDAAGGGGGLKIRPPAQGGKAGTYDPNYQTLAGMNNDEIFKKKEQPGGKQGGEMNIRPPAQGGKVGTYDPNYQTLAGMNNDDVFKRKDGGGGAGGGEMQIKAPQDKHVVPTFDPNYQTLANLGNDCFGADKKKAPEEKKIDFMTY